MITLDPMLPNAVWLTLALAGAALLVFYALRRPPAIRPGRWFAIATLMFVSFALILTLLLNPTFVREIPPPPGKPLLTILVDATASMATPDAGDPAAPQSRLAAAVATARAIEKSAGDAIEVQLRTFTDTTSPAPAEITPDGLTTDIAAAIFASVDADRPQGQGLVLLTDGIQTADPASAAAALAGAARFAKAAGVPIYAQPLGGQGSGKDLALDARTPQELAFLNQRIVLRAQLRTRNHAGEVTVHLLHEGKEIDARKVAATPDATAAVAFEVSQPAVGVYPYEVRVDPVPGELTAANNSATMLLRVVDRPVRVLLLEGKPYWDSKFLTRMLALDPSIELHTQVRIAPGRVMHRVLSRRTAGTGPATASAPGVDDTWKIVRDASETLHDPAGLANYQIILLGRDAEEFLSDTALANLQKWIGRDGGSLICYRGSPVTQLSAPLARLLPVKWQPIRESRFHLRLTDIGRDLNFFGVDTAGLASLPALATAQQVNHTKPLAVTLALASHGNAAEETPALSYQPYGSGRTVVIEGSGLWRWAFLPVGESRDDVYPALWHGLFRWLISSTGLPPGEAAALRADKISFSVTEAATATILTRAAAGPADLSVELTRVDAASQPAPQSFPASPLGDDPGAFRANFGKLAEGRYLAQLANAPAGATATRTLFDVRRLGEEQLNLTARPDLLELLARDSGGQLLTDPAALVRDFQLHLRAARPTRLDRTPAWDRWYVLAALLAVWTVTWALRRSSGLV